MSDHISRDAAIELLSQPITMSMCLSVEECHHKIAQQRIDRYLIENIPAADVRPMVRGKWIQRKNWTRCVCSACSWEITFVTGNSYNYCPNCGADMREES